MINPNEETKYIETSQTHSVQLYQENGKWICEQRESLRRGGYRVINRCVNKNKDKCYAEMVEVLEESYQDYKDSCI